MDEVTRSRSRAEPLGFKVSALDETKNHAATEP